MNPDLSDYGRIKMVLLIITKLAPSLTLKIIREMGLLKCIKSKFNTCSILDHISLPISKLSQTKGLFGCQFLLTLGESNLVQIFPHLNYLFSISFYFVPFRIPALLGAGKGTLSSQLV